MRVIEHYQNTIQPFTPGSLWSLVQSRTQSAHDRGAIQSLFTEYEYVSDGGITFLVRILASLAQKDEVKMRQQADDNEYDPFLPYDRDLFVADVTATHVCLLNKFNVLDHHILIVTREYEEQEAPLTRQDFEALWRCMVEFEGLGFYNAGHTAGASQRHKHLQIVPLPLAPCGPKIPIEPVVQRAEYHGRCGFVPMLPFRHVLSRIHPLEQGSPLERVEELYTCYQTLLQDGGVESAGRNGLLGPYNLLVTREWMLLVPRSKECFQGISVNSLGFAGALLVKDRRQLRVVKRYGPMTVLREVGVPCGLT